MPIRCGPGRRSRLRWRKRSSTRRSVAIPLTPNARSGTIERMFARIPYPSLAAPLVAAVCAVALLLGLAAPSPGAATPSHYRVHAGDSLWSIAERAYPQVDTRAAVYSIQTANHLDG